MGIQMFFLSLKNDYVYLKAKYNLALQRYKLKKRVYLINLVTTSFKKIYSVTLIYSSFGINLMVFKLRLEHLGHLYTSTPKSKKIIWAAVRPSKTGFG